MSIERSDTLVFLVTPFRRTCRGRIVPEQVSEIDCESEADRRARRAAAGAVIMARAGVDGLPSVVRVVGDVPREAVQALESTII